MIAIIGSAALDLHGFNVGEKFKRELGDVDFVGDYDELVARLQANNCGHIRPFAEGKKMVARNSHTIYECDIAWPDSMASRLLAFILQDEGTKFQDGFAIASPHVVFMLKMTHRYKKNNPHFLKTMQDIRIMRKLGYSILPQHEEFYKQRLKETLDYGHPKLDQSKKDFFTDSVPYKYDHDTVHEAVKLFDKPAYNYYKPDESEVMTDKNMFFALPHEFRLAGVYEEACVLALERSQVPYPETPRDQSFAMALEKVCTSITSGWFREFAWEHYHEVVAIYKIMTAKGKNYVDVFNSALEQGGIIQPFKKEMA